MYLKICFKCFKSAYVKKISQKICSSCYTRINYYDHPEKLTILHADMDAFFANVEIYDNPHLKGKPVIVGGDPNGRGVVSTCSYEARKYGVHSAMPLFKAKKLCPNAVFIYPRMERYLEVSKQIFKVFESFTPDYEPLSIDEAFLDMKGTENLFGHPVMAAMKIKNKVKSQTGLTVSIGVATNKFLAKLASDENKPDGIFILTYDTFQNYLDNLKIEKMWGIGKKTLPQLKNNNINFIKDIRISTDNKLKRVFGNSWQHFKNLSMGIDERVIETFHEIKSISNETTLKEDISERSEMLKIFWELSEKISRRLNRKKMRGLTVTIKVKTNRFKLITRSVTLKSSIYMDIDIYEQAKVLLEKIELSLIKVRLLGINISNFKNPINSQLSLFGAVEKDAKKEILNDAIHSLKDRFGDKAITRALNLDQ